MKKAIALLLSAAILAAALTACGENNEAKQEQTAATNENIKDNDTTSGTVQSSNSYSKWNSVFIAENGNSMTFTISESGSVEYEYRYSSGNTESFFDKKTEINGDTITMNGSDFDTEYGAEFTLNGDVLHCFAWNKTVEETEKNVYIDIDMYRDGKLENGAEITTAASTTAVTVRPEKIQYIYKRVRDDMPEDWDYYNAGEFMEVVYEKNGGIEFRMVFLSHNPDTYASYASESEIGTFTSVQSYSGNADGGTDCEFIGNAKVEFSGDYAYVTFEEGETVTLIKAE